ncbi:hypothetical protein CFC21_108227 [Triticum aestivum]|uniref:Uncharacterized protein n=4 Tax=Triticinae TaxID=1648030 RepID=A0A453R561_AEGTS|nr:hypothetical protein CFC21_108227 [Triticum aestivum]
MPRRRSRSRSRRPTAASRLEAPEGRPAYVCASKSLDYPVPASALRHWAPDPPEVSSGRPRRGSTVYVQMTPEMDLEARRIGYAFIAPDPEAAGLEDADTKALVRSAIHATAPDLQFELFAVSPMMADMCLRFALPEDRVAAMAKQPFELDGYSVQIGPDPKSCIQSRLDYLVHINLHNYPKEERTEKDIHSNCSSIGHVVEIDPACFTAPDLSPLGLVVQLKHPREIARELRIQYVGWYGSGQVCPREVARTIMPVEIVKVWDLSRSNDGNGGYVSPFKPSPQVVPDGQPAAAEELRPVPGSRLDYLVHINLHNYPREGWTEKDISSNCSSIGLVVEIDPACFAAPELSRLRLVVRLENPCDIPHELRIKCGGWNGSGGVCPREGPHSVVRVEIVKVWDESPSNGGNGGRYVSPFKPSPAGAL